MSSCVDTVHFHSYQSASIFLARRGVLRLISEFILIRGGGVGGGLRLMGYDKQELVRKSSSDFVLV